MEQHLEMGPRTGSDGDVAGEEDDVFRDRNGFPLSLRHNSGPPRDPTPEAMTVLRSSGLIRETTLWIPANLEVRPDTTEIQSMEFFTERVREREADRPANGEPARSAEGDMGRGAPRFSVRKKSISTVELAMVSLSSNSSFIPPSNSACVQIVGWIGEVEVSRRRKKKKKTKTSGGSRMEEVSSRRHFYSGMNQRGAYGDSEDHALLVPSRLPRGPLALCNSPGHGRWRVKDEAQGTRRPPAEQSPSPTNSPRPTCPPTYPSCRRNQPVTSASHRRCRRLLLRHRHLSLSESRLPLPPR